METRSFCVRGAIGLALLVVFGTAQATVLTFGDMESSPGVPLIDYDDIPGTYGDAVTAVGGPPGGSYGMGNGWTPNVQTSYKSVTGTGVQVDAHLDYWFDNYGDLVDVAFSPTNGAYARLTLTPDAGYSVTLNSFDLAGWYEADLTADRIRVYNSSGTVVFNMDGTTVLGAGGTVHSSYSPAFTSSGAITIEWGANWNIGIDNVNFDQTATPVPEPITLALAAGALGLAARRRRK